MSSALQKTYNEIIRSELMSEFGYKNVHQIPKVEKVIINVGIGTYVAKVNSDYSLVEETVASISGQKPCLKKAKLSVSNFNKLREGQPNGLMVTLRGERMYYFLEKLINFTLPRVRDFKGIKPSTMDRQGNVNIGVTDHTIFPEIVVNDAVKPHGIQITIVTSSTTQKEGYTLLKKMKFPFRAAPKLEQ
jgi:large subunit ribosomal protein L5